MRWKARLVAGVEKERWYTSGMEGGQCSSYTHYSAHSRAKASYVSSFVSLKRARE